MHQLIQKKLEVIAFNIESCVIAEDCGVHRIELCDNPQDGGTTPSYGFIKMAREVLSMDLYPIIRPRGGDFLYSNEAFEVMKNDVAVCKDLGCNGVVIGILLPNGMVDKIRCQKLIDIAFPLKVTFHRAFDRTVDIQKALEDIIEIGCERILTSGQKPNVNDALDTIKYLIQEANNRIIIMPGSGVTASNIKHIAEQTNATEFHSSARMKKYSEMHYYCFPMNENLTSTIIEKEEVLKMLSEIQ